MKKYAPEFRRGWHEMCWVDVDYDIISKLEGIVGSVNFKRLRNQLFPSTDEPLDLDELDA